MDGLLKQAAAETQIRARSTGEIAISTVITQSGRECTVRAIPVRNWLFFKKTDIVFEYKDLDG
jgi:hypothetical protein